MKRASFAAAIIGLVSIGASLGSVASATTPATVSQYATGATASSQYDSVKWSPAQATGAPNVTSCGDSENAWASQNGNLVETLTLTFASAMTVNEIKIWNNINPNALTKVEVRNGNGAKTTVFTRSTTDSLTTGAKATGAACDVNSVTPHDLKKATNATALPTTPINTVILTFDEASLYAVSRSNQWAGETDAVQISGPAPAKPAFTKGAAINGTAAVNKWLTAADGTWTGSPTYTYQWYTCTASGLAAPSLPAGCTMIAGKTASTLQLTTAQKGKYVRVRVTGTNAGGATVSFSPTTAKIS